MASNDSNAVTDPKSTQHATPFSSEDHVPIFQRVSITGEDTGGVSEILWVFFAKISDPNSIY